MADSISSRLSNAGTYALQLDGVSRHFGALVALEGISLTVRAGERRAVLGSNGAGKTTLFNAIITVQWPECAGQRVSGLSRGYPWPLLVAAPRRR